MKPKTTNLNINVPIETYVDETGKKYNTTEKEILQHLMPFIEKQNNIQKLKCKKQNIIHKFHQFKVDETKLTHYDETNLETYKHFVYYFLQNFYQTWDEFAIEKDTGEKIPYDEFEMMFDDEEEEYHYKIIRTNQPYQPEYLTHIHLVRNQKEYLIAKKDYENKSINQSEFNFKRNLYKDTIAEIIMRHLQIVTNETYRSLNDYEAPINLTKENVTQFAKFIIESNMINLHEPTFSKEIIHNGKKYIDPHFIYNVNHCLLWLCYKLDSQELLDYLLKKGIKLNNPLINDDRYQQKENISDFDSKYHNSFLIHFFYKNNAYNKNFEYNLIQLATQKLYPNENYEKNKHGKQEAEKWLKWLKIFTTINPNLEFLEDNSIYRPKPFNENENEKPEYVRQIIQQKYSINIIVKLLINQIKYKIQPEQQEKYANCIKKEIYKHLNPKFLEIQNKIIYPIEIQKAIQFVEFLKIQPQENMQISEIETTTLKTIYYSVDFLISGGFKNSNTGKIESCYRSNMHLRNLELVNHIHPKELNQPQPITNNLLNPVVKLYEIINDYNGKIKKYHMKTISLSKLENFNSILEWAKSGDLTIFE